MSFFRICGYKPGSFKPSTEIGISMIHPDDREKATKAVEDSLKNNMPYAIEKRIVRPDGSIRWVQSLGRVVYDKFDDSNKLMGSFLDISERKRAEEEIKNTLKKLEELYKLQDEIKENERRAISREIHDELGQSLTALKIDLFWTKEHCKKNISISKKISGMIDIVSDTIKKVQRISSELRPGLLDDLGLVPAIEWYVQEFEKRTKINCLLELEDVDLLDQRKNLALYRIVQESFTNISRHSKANRVIVRFFQNDDNAILEIIDNGKGFNPKKVLASNKIGIIGIQERVKQFNGSFSINSELDKGTSIHIIIPINY